MIPLVTPSQMRAIDAAASDRVEELIDRAGAAVARAALEMLGGGYGRTVAVLAGPGNNGADGRVAAERLRQRGVAVRVYDARNLPPVLSNVDLVIDAAFGTGFRDVWRAPYVGDAMVLAVDVPTGLDGLTGEAPATVLAADRTVTFAAAKPGHVLGDGPDVVGQLTVAEIGLDIGSTTSGIVQDVDVASWIPPRPRTSHKWSSAVRLVAGSPGMTGAAALAAGAAQRTGSGMVVVSSPGVDPGSEHMPVEAVGRSLVEDDWGEMVLADLDRFGALAIGPGLGRHEATIHSAVHVIAEAPIPIVVDGDALFAICAVNDRSPAWLRDRSPSSPVPVLTPHDGEYERLTGVPPDVDRIAAAHELVELTGCVALLKGPTTVVAGPDGRTMLVIDGDQRLATAGTGDVLTGIIAGLLARGIPPLEAAAAGAWIHARSAAECDRVGMVASDIVGAIAGVIAGLSR